MPWSNPALILRLIALLFLCEFVRSGFFIAFLPLRASDFSLTAGTVGLIVGGHYLADALAKGPIGMLTERWGLGRLMAAAATAGLLLVLATPITPTWLLLVTLSVLWGLTYTALWPGIMTVVSRDAREGQQARALSLTTVSIMPGIALGAVGLGALMSSAPDLAYPALLVAQALALLLALSLLGVRVPPAERDAPKRSWSNVAGLLPPALAQTLAPGLMMTLFYPFLERTGITLQDLLVPGLMGGALAAGLLPLAGRLADRTSPRMALVPGLVSLAGSFVLLALPNPETRLFLILALFAAGFAVFTAGWNGLLARTLPEENRSAAWGTVMTFETLGYALGPIIGGFVWQSAGPGGTFALGAALYLLAVLLHATRRVPKAAPQEPTPLRVR